MKTALRVAREASVALFVTLVFLASTAKVDANEPCTGLTFNDDSGRLGFCLPEGQSFVLTPSEGGRRGEFTLTIVKKKGQKISADHIFVKGVEVDKRVSGFTLAGQWKD